MVEKRSDVAIISEPYARLILDDTRWTLYRSERAALGVMNDVFTVSKIEQEDGFVAAKVNGVTVYICYASPNSPIANFRAMLDKFEQSVRQKQGDIIIVGDVNARSAAWMDTITDSRGEDLSLFIDTICLDVVNARGEPTFIGRGAGSIVDVTFISETLARRMMEWKVLEDEDTSNHQNIEFRLGNLNRSGAHRTDVGASKDRGWMIANVEPDRISAGLLLAKWTAKRQNHGPGARGCDIGT